MNQVLKHFRNECESALTLTSDWTTQSSKDFKRRAIGEITVILYPTRLLAPPTNSDRAW